MYTYLPVNDNKSLILLFLVEDLNFKLHNSIFHLMVIGMLCTGILSTSCLYSFIVESTSYSFH